MPRGFDRPDERTPNVRISGLQETRRGRERGSWWPRLDHVLTTPGVGGAARTSPPASLDRDPPTMRELGIRRGMLVADNYRIVRAVGAGGMGLVTLARDERLDRNVAIKLIRPELLRRHDLRAFFLREARAMARVSHPNVLTVHAFGEHEGIPYFVMEYVDGWTVERWLAEEGGPPPVDDALHVIEQACLGVEAIHAARAVHRDIKPSNLLMDASRRVAVGDLGVARILEDVGGGDACCVVGSATYMAPEAALGDDSMPELATRRDIYALGCVAYELFTGRPPFVAPNDVSLMAKHLLESPSSATTLRPELPPALDGVLLRALDKDPSRRWPTASAFGAALSAVRAGEAEPTRILVADDDDDWRATMCAALAGCFPTARIDGARDGKEALDAFLREPYSVVLVDLRMPGLDGAQVAGRLRSLDASARTAILVLTAAGGPSEWRTLSQIGVDAFLVKPAELEDVAMMIRRTLRSRRSRA